MRVWKSYWFAAIKTGNNLYVRRSNKESWRHDVPKWYVLTPHSRKSIHGFPHSSCVIILPFQQRNSTHNGVTFSKCIMILTVKVKGKQSHNT
jgi:hypothetical protein